MEKFIGVKLIKAKGMNRLTYNLYRGWELPKDEDGADEGFLVEYLDSPNGNHPDHEGYISWSPKEQFENAYRKTNGMTFGLAIEAMKKCKRVARKGWNGKGIFVEIQNPDLDSRMSSPYIFINTTGLQTDNPDAPKSLVPWLASQTDMLAEDWEIIE